VLPLFFLEAIRLTRRRVQIDTMAASDGAAVWMCPGQKFNFVQMVRMGLLAMPFKMGNSFKRCLRLANSVEDVHHRLMRESHWYLMALAVESTQQRRMIARALLEPGLLRADSDGLRCYLETFQESDLRFYEELGFRIAGAGCIAGGPNFWALIRAPKNRFERRLPQRS
jgi:ribosomal protein S18 acetylase RimI-like enzyme